MTDNNSENNKGSKKTDPSNKTDKAEHVKNEPAKKESTKKTPLSKSDVKIEKPVKDKSKTATKKKILFNAKPVPKMEASKNEKSSWLPIISFILIVLLFSVLGWIFYQQQLINQSLQTIKTKTKKDLQEQNAKVSRVVETNTASINEINLLKQGLQSLANHNNDLKLQLLSAQEKIKSLSGRRKQDWMLAEVEYLINIAKLKLSLQKDRNTAIQLLKTADDRLIELSDQSLTPIREAIVNDISNLSLIQESDITGIVIKLNAMEKQINQLELLAFKLDKKLDRNTLIDKNSEEQNKPKQDEGENSLTNLSKIYKRFVSEFIVIKDHSETPQPLMTPKQRGNLNQNIQLALQQAQIAALQGNERLYLLNLDKVIKWIDQYFGKNEEPSLIIKQIEELKNEKVDVRYPTQLESTGAIEIVNKNQLYDWLDNSLKPSNINVPKFEPLDDSKNETIEVTKQ